MTKLCVVQIAGNRVEVWRSKDTILVDDVECDGAFYPQYGRIVLSSKLRGAQLQETLIHELCHAVEFYFGLELGESEERVCLAMGRGLVSGLAPYLKQIRRVKDEVPKD